jgi:hypothetical protein
MMHTMSQLRQKIAKKGAKGKSSNCDWMHLVFQTQMQQIVCATCCHHSLMQGKKEIKLY